MKVALIGATGFVGKSVLAELLNRGHEGTAVVRNTSNLKPREGLTPVQADVIQVSDLTRAVEGHEALISAFNSGWQNPNLYEDFLEGSRAIQKAAEVSGINRLIVVGGAGSLYVGGKQLVDAPDFPNEWKAGANAARDYLQELQDEKTLDWVFLSPAIEMHPGTSGLRKGSYRLGTEHPVFNDQGRSVISVEDLAVAIVDELEQKRHSRERFTVAY